jgi:hypothetical protein
LDHVPRPGKMHLGQRPSCAQVLVSILLADPLKGEKVENAA